MSKTNPDRLREIDRTIASVIIISADHKILMGRKDPTGGGVYPDAWHIPGGGVDEDETLEDAARREAHEEVGLDLAAGQIVPLNSIGHGEALKTLGTGERVWCHMTFHRFEVRLNQPAEDIKVRPSDDLVELRWFDRAELGAVEQIPGGRELFVEAGYIDADTSPKHGVVAIGACYIDINTSDYPFTDTGIAPETELVGSGYELVPGGSAVNFCRLLAKLDVDTTFVGMAGTDPSGQLLEDLLRQSGVNPALIRQDGLHTNVSFDMTNPAGQHIMLVAGTANATLNADAALPVLTEILPVAQILYLGGCFKLTGLMADYPAITALAARHRTQVIVDHGRVPSGTPSAVLETVRQLVLQSSYYFPSKNEFCQLWGVTTIADGLSKLADLAPQTTIVVKDGPGGAHYLEDGKPGHIPGKKVQKVVDATGAGDSFNAGVIAGVIHGLSLSQAIAYACSVAAAKITRSTIPLLPR